MSATLGPIHYWMYNKIKVQNSLVDEIISLAENKLISTDLRSKSHQQFGSIDVRPLEELIDTTNIHGWLQECVSIVEYRLAFVITTLLEKEMYTIEDLKKMFENAGGRASSLKKGASISEIYKVISDTLLDGMPCDHANTVLSQDENEVIWKRNVCVHEQYWVAVGGNIQYYYQLREEFIKGMISNTGAIFEKIDELTSKLMEKEASKIYE